MLTVRAHTVIDDEGEDIQPAVEAATGENFDFEIPTEGVVPSGGFMDKVKDFFSHEPEFYVKHYPMELCFVAFFVLYLLNFFYGREQNNKFALAARNAFFEPLHK